MAETHQQRYRKAVAFFRGTQLGEAARAARWRAALWVASANDETCYTALESLQCAPDRLVPGARYAALSAPDRALLDVAGALLEEGTAVDLAAPDLDAGRRAIVSAGLRLRDGADPASLPD